MWRPMRALVRQQAEVEPARHARIAAMGEGVGLLGLIADLTGDPDGVRGPECSSRSCRGYRCQVRLLLLAPLSDSEESMGLFRGGVKV
jgi:hypothetical protein